MPNILQLCEMSIDMLTAALDSQELLEVATNIKLGLTKKEYCLSREPVKARRMDRHGPSRFIQRLFTDEDIECRLNARIA
jgi:hypothetical protein